MKKEFFLMMAIVGLSFVGLAVVRTTDRVLYSGDDYVPRIFYSSEEESVAIIDGIDIKDFIEAKDPDEIIEKYSYKHNLTKQEAEGELRAKAREYLSDGEIIELEKMGKNQVVGFLKAKVKQQIKDDKERF